MPNKDPEARKAYIRAWYLKNRERLLVYSAEYRQKFPEKVSEGKKRIYHNKYKNDPERKAKVSAYAKKRRIEKYDHVRAIERASYEKHRDRALAYGRATSRTVERKAREAVGVAIRKGLLARASECSCARCGEQANEYHHPSYDRDKWTDVVAVCHQCHKDIHRDLSSAST